MKTPVFRGSRKLILFSMLLALMGMGSCENISPDIKLKKK